MPPNIKQTLSLLTALILTFHAYCQTEEGQAFRFLNEALQKDSKNSELLLIRGFAFADAKKYDSAIADFNAALRNLKSQHKATPFHNDKPLDSIDVLAMRAYCYDVTDAVGNSVADYRYLQAAKPNDFMYSIAVARVYIKHKDFAKAQSEIDRLKELPENERGLVYQAILFYEMERYSDGLEAADTALKKYPASIEGLVTKAKILAKLGKTNQACERANEAKSKISADYFGGQAGYERDFERDIDNLKTLYCK